jgi:hypothetical protein
MSTIIASAGIVVKCLVKSCLGLFMRGSGRSSKMPTGASIWGQKEGTRGSSDILKNAAAGSQRKHSITSQYLVSTAA